MMQNVKNANSPEPFVSYKRIVSTTFKVGIYFNEEAKEQLDDKVLRMLKNDLQYPSKSAIVESLQAG